MKSSKPSPGGKKISNVTQYIFFLPAGLVLIAIVIYPLIYSLIASLTDIELLKLQSASFVGLENFIRSLKDKNFLISLWNTVLFVAVVVTIEFLIGLALALFVTVDIPGIKVLKTVLIVPTVLAPVVVGLMWRYMLFKGHGVLSYLLYLLHFEPETGILGNVIWARIAIYLTDIWEWSGFMALIFLAGIVSIPKELYEAAKVDGAAPFHIFVRITLPMLKPTILIAVIIRTMDAFCVYDIVYTITRGGPGMVTTTVSYQIYRTTIRFGELGYGSALAWILMVVVVLISIVYIKVAYRREKI